MHSLLKPTKLSELCKEFQRYQILGLAERLLFSGNHFNQGREYGIGFFQSTSAVAALIEWPAHSDLMTKGHSSAVFRTF